MENRSFKIACLLVAMLAISFGSQVVQSCSRNSDCAGYSYQCGGECIKYYCAGDTCYCSCESDNKLSIVALQEKNNPTKLGVNKNNKP